MSNETERNPQQQKQQGPQDPTVNASDAKTDPLQRNQSQSNPQPDTFKKNPSQDSDAQQKGQQKPEEDEKRRAS